MTDNDDLWRGHKLNHTNWHDLERSLQIVSNELSDGLHNQRLGQVKKASRWLQAVAVAIHEKTVEVEREMG